jgi:hypothetical protein
MQLRSRIYERTVSLMFLGIILRVFRLEVSVYNVYITNQFQTTFAPLLEVTVNSKEENSYDFCSNYVQEFGLRKGNEAQKLRKKEQVV